jgi:hypothetical protein
MVVLLVGGGVALLWGHQQGNLRTRAAGDVSVAGSPTLSATTIDAIFARVGSPMAGIGKVVEQTSRQTNIDDGFALAVWWTETNDGAAGVGLADRNPGSVRGSVGYPSAFDGYTIYPSYTAAIIYWFNMLRNNYVDRGLSTVYAIARPYVGTASYPLWAGKVINLIYNYRGIAPPPVSTPQPKPTVNPAIVAANNARIRKLTPWLQFLSAHTYTAPVPDAGRIQEQIVSSTGSQQPNTAPALPPATKLSIVLFGLLSALALALFSLKMPVATVQQRERQVGMMAATGRGQAIAPTMDGRASQAVSSIVGAVAYPRPAVGYQFALSAHAAPFPHSFHAPAESRGYPSYGRKNEPTTDDLPVLPTSIPMMGMLSLPSRKRVTEALPRRVVLVSSRIAPETPMPAGVGSGLLSRYRE